MNVIFSSIICYLIGALPISSSLSKLIYGKDLRNHGSGNIGFSNSYRLFGFFFGSLIALVDLFRGYAAVTLISQANPYSGMFFVCMGQMFSIFTRFSGGKGVGCYLGAVLGFNFNLGLGLIVFWQIFTIFLKHPFLSSLISLIISLYYMPDNYLQLLLCLIILIKHSGNLYVFFNSQKLP